MDSSCTLLSLLLLLLLFSPRTASIVAVVAVGEEVDDFMVNSADSDLGRANPKESQDGRRG